MTAWALGLYAVAARLGTPLIVRHLHRRAKRGKEDPVRLLERFGRASLPRPDGALVWMHGASIGESLSLLPLIDHLRAERPDLHILITAGTVSAVALLQRRLPPGVAHQYAPVDTPQAVTRFLDHWRPTLSIWVESEIWPNLLDGASQRGRLVLLNARMSERSARRWAMAPRSTRRLLHKFDLIAPQTPDIAARLITLGAPKERIRVAGNLKAAAPPLPCDENRRAALSAALGDRPRWVAASVHPGEDAAIAAAHKSAAAIRPGLLTIVVPRHPTAASGVAQTLRRAGLRVSVQSQGGELNPAASDASNNDVFIADSFGEMGLWLRLTPIAFMGGSLVPVGGHNPLEAAKLGRAILHGPHTENAAADYAALNAAGAARRVDDADGLASAVQALLDQQTGPQAVAAMGEAALAADPGPRALESIWRVLAPFLPPDPNAVVDDAFTDDAFTGDAFAGNAPAGDAFAAGGDHAGA